MLHIKVTTKVVESLLQKLSLNKAIGPDLVPARILKDYTDDIAPILQLIYQQSLDIGIVPDDWKMANVAAIFKKGDCKIAPNYMQVLLTCISCKILEHIVFYSIKNHVDLHQILVFF